MISLVTGGAGFIGSHIVDRLLAEGQQVRILDNFSTGKRENLPADSNAEIIEGDISDFETVQKAMQGVTTVFHQAAIASVPTTINDPVSSARVNYLGTVNILEAARQAGAQRVMFASSAAVYGDNPELPKQEDMPLKPLSPYAADKLASEEACRVYHHLYGLEIVCLRYFNIFGPRQDPSSPYSGVISIFSDCIAAGKQVLIYGDGGQTRDFVYVSDVVEANLRAATSQWAPGKAINIGTDNALSINELLKTICKIRQHPFAPDYKPGRQGDIRHSSANLHRAREYLDWKPVVELEEGLRKLFNH